MSIIYKNTALYCQQNIEICITFDILVYIYKTSRFDSFHVIEILNKKADNVALNFISFFETFCCFSLLHLLHFLSSVSFALRVETFPYILICLFVFCHIKLSIANFWIFFLKTEFLDEFRRSSLSKHFCPCELCSSL